MRMQVRNPAFVCFDGTDVWIAAKKVTDDLVLNAVLLCCEGERGGPGLLELGIGSGVEG